MKNLRLIGLAIIAASQVSLALAIGREEYPDFSARYRELIRQHLGARGLAELVSEYIDFESLLNENFRSLLVAIRKGNFAEMQTVIARGVDLNRTNEEGDTPLILVIKMNMEDKDTTDQYRILNLLITNGANINAQDGQGRSALMVALDRELYQIESLLIEKGANVNTKDRRGRTPLMIALDRGLFTVASDLISRTTDLNAILNPEGQTALIIAAKKGKYELVERLIRSGANPNIKDRHGKTAYDYAKESSGVVTFARSYPGEKYPDLVEYDYKKIAELLAPRGNVKREESKRSDSSLSSASSKEMEENIRVARARAAQEERQRQEEERLRSQRAQEAMIAAAAQPEEEEWAEESAPAEEEGWGDLGQED